MGVSMKKVEYSEINLLWLLCEFNVNRYLMANAKGRRDGAEKAEVHMSLSRKFVAWWFGIEVDQASYVSCAGSERLAWVVVHDGTQKLTDKLDEVIGFPLDSRPDYDDLAPKFFMKFYELAIKELEDLELSEDEEWKNNKLKMIQSSSFLSKLMM